MCEELNNRAVNKALVPVPTKCVVNLIDVWARSTRWFNFSSNFNFQHT